MSEAPKSTDYQCIEETNKKALEFIEDVTANADEVQKRVLTEILSKNAHVEYLKRFGLNGQVDRETFKKIMPVITYEDIQSDIKCIANGDKSPILCSQPISKFLASDRETRGGNRRGVESLKLKNDRFSGRGGRGGERGGGRGRGGGGRGRGGGGRGRGGGRGGGVRW